ncbi:DUF3159 domain-containing protein [Leucobacter weissii]|uniref:DUF3159 domain-containing protein n=1 Tax=Leucobacter weissii TaxID=1983706 RepID=A0A939S8A9_9MICO|nr:DUF3159 domain-containing protein [Leucobacter weissii]MBO1901871.1 DUF3159 domain-containing protein [Leucobacter weissii]
MGPDRPGGRAEPEDSAEPSGDGERDARLGGLGRAVQAGLGGEAVTARGVLDAIGGVRGLVEAFVPATLFLVVYVLAKDARIAAIAPLAIAVLAVVVRLIRREPLSAALSGVLGVVVCVAAVMFTGEGSSYFVPGFFINGAWILAHTVSLLVGWPLIGLLLGFLRGSLTAWRKVPVLRRAAVLCTLVWIALFAARLLVQLPLYFADDTEALGVARLVMGVPLFALAVLFTWLVLARVSSAVDADEARAEAAGSAPGEGTRSSSDE